MTKRIAIETNPRQPTPYSDQAGQYRTSAILRVAGACASGGPGGWRVGGWDATGEGRIVDGGPIEKGPHAFIYGLCGVIDNHGGTGAEHDRAAEEGRLFDVEAGDEIVLAGDVYAISVDSRGYPSLTFVESAPAEPTVAEQVDALVGRLARLTGAPQEGEVNLDGVLVRIVGRGSMVGDATVQILSMDKVGTEFTIEELGVSQANYDAGLLGWEFMLDGLDPLDDGEVPREAVDELAAKLDVIAEGQEREAAFGYDASAGDEEASYEAVASRYGLDGDALYAESQRIANEPPTIEAGSDRETLIVLASLVYSTAVVSESDCRAAADRILRERLSSEIEPDEMVAAIAQVVARDQS